MIPKLVRRCLDRLQHCHDVVCCKVVDRAFGNHELELGEKGVTVEDNEVIWRIMDCLNKQLSKLDSYLY